MKSQIIEHVTSQIKSRFKSQMSFLAHSFIVPSAGLQSLSKSLRSRPLSSKEISDLKRRMLEQKLTLGDVAQEMYLSAEGLELAVQRAMTNHLFYIHNARLKMIKNILPAGEQIVDLGGANAPLYEMGYPYPFKHLTMVDLPLEDRHQEFRKVVKTSKTSGKVEILYSDMTNLKVIPDGSVDFVWSGQSIEHISIEQGDKMLSEAYRILKPGGKLALDTPNRTITKIHTRAAGFDGFIHPDHKHEYMATELATKIKTAGFRILDQKGICEMPRSSKGQDFYYEDFVLGNPISDNIDASYILFFSAQKD